MCCCARKLTEGTSVQLRNFANALVVPGRVGFIADEGVKQRLVCGSHVASPALEAGLHAVVEDGEEVAIVNAVADSNVVLQRRFLVVRRRGRLWWRGALCDVSAAVELRGSGALSRSGTAPAALETVARLGSPLEYT